MIGDNPVKEMPMEKEKKKSRLTIQLQFFFRLTCMTHCDHNAPMQYNVCNLKKLTAKKPSCLHGQTII